MIDCCHLMGTALSYRSQLMQRNCSSRTTDLPRMISRPGFIIRMCCGVVATDWAAEGTYPGVLGFGLVDPYDDHFRECNPRRAMCVYSELRTVWCGCESVVRLRDFSSCTASSSRVSMHSSQSLLCLAAQRGNDHYMTTLCSCA